MPRSTNLEWEDPGRMPPTPSWCAVSYAIWSHDVGVVEQPVHGGGRHQVVLELREGVVFELAAVPLGDGRIGVDVDLTHSSLERPIRTVTRVIGAGRHEVTIGKPEVTEVGVHTRLIMRAGATAVFVTPDPVQDLDMATLVRLRRVVPSELGLDRVPAAGERRTREK